MSNRRLEIKNDPQRLAFLLVALLMSEPAAADYAGRRVGDVLNELRASGLTFIYSTQRVPADLSIEHEPAAQSGRELASEILAAHGLGISEVAPGVYTVVPRSSLPASTRTEVDRIPREGTREATVEEVVVQTSRYALAAESVSQTFLTQDEVKSMPRLADETLRALQRLPGTATNGFSSLGSVRGGEPNETGIVLDGLRLYEPFHLKNFLSPVSLLDSRVIEGIEFYSGGYPAIYGDRMSAIVDAATVRPSQAAYYELGLSLFHAQALGALQFDDGRGQVLMSARRSNAGDLAHYAENEFGEPNYSDAFARADYQFTDDTSGSFHLLWSRDEITAVRGSGTQQANAEYHNVYTWGSLDHQWSTDFASRLIVSYTELENERSGSVNEPSARRGAVRDERTFHILGLRLENDLSGPVAHRFGLEARRLWGSYDYASALRIEPDFPFPGSPAIERQRVAAPKPDGFEAGAYWEARVNLTDHWIVNAGLRVDTQTYDGSDDGEQLSPRLSLLYAVSPQTHLRASWGRYFQSQGINELQVEDGVDRFHPAQYADHAIVSFEHASAAGFDLRIEGYVKDYRRVSPRFENVFDPLTLFPEAEFDRVRIDPDRTRATGLDVLLRMRPHGSWSGWLAYAWSRVEDHIDGHDVPRSWDQRHAVNLGVTWARGPWTATIIDSYHSGWPTTALEIDYASGAPMLLTDGRNRDRFTFYNSLDFRVTRTFALPRGVLDAFVEVSNTLDRENQCCVDYEVGEANGVPTYTRQVESWLPLVPSIGVLWRFGEN